MIRTAFLAALLVVNSTACVSGSPYASAHWVGSFVFDADESRAGTECTLQRVVHIDAALDCGPAYVAGGLARYRCGGAGSAHYSYTRLSAEGAQKQAGTGSYTGEISGLLEIYGGRYRFDARPLVPGTYEAAKGEYTSVGPETIILIGVIPSEEGVIAEHARTMTFDRDLKAGIEGLDCRTGPDAGRRHVTFSLADSAGPPASLRPPTPTRSAAPTGDGTPRPGTTDVRVGSRPAAIAFDPKTARAYVANAGDGTVSVIDTITERAIATIAVGPNPNAIAVSPSTERVYVVHPNERQLSVIDTRSDRVIGVIPVNGRPNRIAVHPDTGRVYVTVQAGPLRVDDAAAAVELGVVRIVYGAGAIALNPLSGRVYVSGGDGVAVIDAATGRTLITWRLGTESGTGNIAVNPRTDRVYVADAARDGLWMIDSSGVRHRVIGLVALPREAWGVLVSEETNRVYATNLSYGEVYIIDGGSGQVTETIPSRGMAWGIWDIAVDPATHRIFAAVSDRNTVMILR